MKHLKNLILVVATAIILILITATIVESSKGTAFVRQHIYTSAWFVVLWAALAVAAAVYIVLRKNKSNISTSVLLVHASFLVILLGAFTSWNMAESGTIHLRQNETTSTMKDEEGKTKELGFEVSLKNFNVVNYPGTDAPMDYVTMLTANTQEIKVSMNNIGSFSGYRFIQSGYDSDMQGTTLGVYHDPWGIGITYTGYALLFISLIATMASKKTRLRHLYRKALSLQGAKAWAVTALLAVSSFATSANAQEMVKIDGDIADDFGNICVLYNSRITPINTVATSFVTKLCGKPTWDGLSSNQVFAGWIFDVPYWETVKMIEIKEKKRKHKSFSASTANGLRLTISGTTTTIINSMPRLRKPIKTATQSYRSSCAMPTRSLTSYACFMAARCSRCFLMLASRVTCNGLRLVSHSAT